MTYSVPYSFVPGTKAKADEVNANFNDVIDKLSTTNNTVAQKLNLDLSNINEDGQEILDAKADVVDLDGNWTLKNQTLLSGETIVASDYKTYSLSSYLPSDNNVYEVIITGAVESKTTSNNYANISIQSPLCSYQTIARFSGATKIDGNSVIIPVSTNREIYIYSTPTQSGNMTVGLKANAYRKAR